MNNIPESQFARASLAGSAAVKLGIGQLKHTAKRPFLSAGQRQTEQQRLQDSQAQLIFNTLTQLRGTAVKLAQMLGMESDLLPERFRKELEKSYHQVPPLNRTLVRKAILDGFGKPPENVFHRFDSVAFAAASLGQVHAATLADGSEIAVKIQYPGIHTAIDSDMRLLRKFVIGLPNKKIALQSIEEVHARLCEEVNYQQEADNTRWFKTNLRCKGIEVPSVYSDFCTERVLTTTLLSGEHLEAWMKNNPCQSLRDLVAQRIYDLFVHSTMDLMRLHADPNPGNFLFRTDGSIGLIDFGCIKRLSEPFVQKLPTLLNAYAKDDSDQLMAAYAAMGMTIKTQRWSEFESVLKPFGRWLALPFRDEFFDFGQHKDYTSSGLEHIQRLARFSGVDSITNDFIFFDRTVYGLCKIFERLGARVRMRHHWQNR